MKPQAIISSSSDAKTWYKMLLPASFMTLVFFLLIPFAGISPKPKDKIITLQNISSSSLPRPLPLPEKQLIPVQENILVEAPPTPQMEVVQETPQIQNVSPLQLQFSSQALTSDISFSFPVRDIKALPSTSKKVITPVKMRPAKNLFQVNELDEAPQVLSRIMPQYPASALRRKLKGHVTLTFILDENAQLQDIQIKDSKPGSTFNKAAINALRQWTFRAGKFKQKKVKVKMEQKFIFDR